MEKLHYRHFLQIKLPIIVIKPGILEVEFKLKMEVCSLLPSLRGKHEILYRDISIWKIEWKEEYIFGSNNTILALHQTQIVLIL